MSAEEQAIVVGVGSWSLLGIICLIWLIATIVHDLKKGMPIKFFLRFFAACGIGTVICLVLYRILP